MSKKYKVEGVVIDLQAWNTAARFFGICCGMITLLVGVLMVSICIDRVVGGEQDLSMFMVTVFSFMIVATGAYTMVTCFCEIIARRAVTITWGRV